MDKLFWVDENRAIRKTYCDLIHDLNCKQTLRSSIYFDNPYSILVELVHSLATGKPVELLDLDFASKGTNNLSNQAAVQEIATKKLELNSVEDLFKLIEHSKDTWSLTSYSSGTTGTPKKVTHTMETLGRMTKIDDRFHGNIWAFAYNPTHFAGIQVFLQAFFNKNTMIYLFDAERNTMNRQLISYQVTNISATSTFYRNLIPFLDTTVSSLKTVTLGGEKFDSKLLTPLSTYFPHATFKNIYASTEAGSLFKGKNETFMIEEKYKNYIKTTSDNELLIHESLLGTVDKSKLNNGWYHTGDMIEFIDERNFRFVSRQSDLINIGGYNVNPHEIEEKIMGIDGVIDVLVIPRANAVTGNILTAEVIKAEHHSDQVLRRKIIAELSSSMQKWKIPQMIKFVTGLNQSRTGKKVRK
ncbi:acyl--CoA ligase [bacterium LRH843]|nr:acyl--CoA ligase [bacterium LRH843]